MIYPDDYKCLICKFRYYACQHRKDSKRMLSCFKFQVKAFRPHKGVNVALARCLFGVCPRFIVKQLNDV